MKLQLLQMCIFVSFFFLSFFSSLSLFSCLSVSHVCLSLFMSVSLFPTGDELAVCNVCTKRNTNSLKETLSDAATCQPHLSIEFIV